MDKPENRHQTDQTFFVTSVIEEREPIFRNDEHAQRFIDALQHFRKTEEIKLYGFVVMPDHVHFVCRVVNGMTISSLVRRIKTFTSRDQLFHWQKGYWTVVISRKEMLIEKLNYMHANPIRAKLVEDLKDYKWSSWQEFYQKPEPEMVDRVT
ncbi:transposase [bacterium]|nr:transposase [bacterium]